MKYIFCYTVNLSSVSVYFQTLCNQLSQRGHDVTVMTDRNIKDRCLLEDSVKMFDWPSVRPVKFADFRFFFRLVRSMRPDVICANFGSVNISMIVGFLCRIRARIAWYHTTTEQIKLDNKITFRSKLLNIRKRFVYKLTTHIFTNSDHTIDDCSKECGVPLKKIKKTLLLLNPPNIVQQEKITNQICFVGRLAESKGQRDLIHALPKIAKKYSDTRVLFLGDGIIREELINLAKQHEVLEYCDFKGNVPIGDVYKILASSYISVSASRSEAFGLVNAESIAVGTPVITTGVGGISESIKDGINGFYFAPENHEQLADLIIKVFEDKMLYEKLSKNSIDFFNDKFSLEKNIGKTVEVYESL